MNQSGDMSVRVVSTSDLRTALERELSRHFGVSRSVVQLKRRTSAYQSSFALEELEVVLDDEQTLKLVFKNLSPDALLQEGRAARPAFLNDPNREIEVYRTVLGPARLGTAICYGTALEPSAEGVWLFLEKVAGVELYQVGEIATWEEVARWLACFHSRFAADADRLGRPTKLLRYGADYYRLWMRRARGFWPELGRLADVFEEVVERLAKLPVTLIHGEFYASNVLVNATLSGLRVCPIDWEMAAVGPGLIDLAALTAGNWSEEAKQSLTLAYLGATPTGAGVSSIGVSSISVAEFLETVDYCRLHQAVRWSGWSADWSPPVAHAQNWPREALRLACKLGLLK